MVVRYRRRESIIFTEVHNEVLALSVDDGHCFGFNEVASAVWAMTNEPRSAQEICDRLGSMFEVEPAECAIEVKLLLETLLAQGLIDEYHATT